MHLTISVIIPAYKAETYLGECLMSIRDQQISTPDISFDILIGIDFCEATLGLLTSILPQFPKARVFYFQEHLGPYVIRNTLATISQANYLVFFDSDDIMPPFFLQGLIEPFKLNDIVRFGLTDFVDLLDRSNEPRRVFNRSKIKQFEKNLNKHHAILFKGEPSFSKKILSLKNSKYLKIARYLHFAAGLYKRRKSGVFAIKKSLFYDMDGYKAWPVQADVEFMARARLRNIKEVMLPKRLNFLRRIHTGNLTSNYHIGMGSIIRQEYERKSKKSIHENDDMVVSLNYTEIVPLV